MSMTDEANRAHGEKVRLRIARALDCVIALFAVAVIFLLVAAAVAPRFKAAFEVGRIDSVGGHAFMFAPSFETHWPYAIPSHPDFKLAPGDVKVTENGKFIGTLEPAHDVIRGLGDGRFNFWEGTVFFSSSDNTDPRTNGRTYGVRVKARLIPAADAARTLSIGVLAALILCRIGALIWVYLARAIARTCSLASRVLLIPCRVSAHMGIHVGRTIVRPWKRWALASQLQTGVAAILRRMQFWLGASVRLAQRVPLTFARTFALVSAAVLAVFCWQSLARPMPLILGVDGYNYVQPGILWAAGRDVAGQSLRDLGYPALTVAALRLGSLSTLPLLQLFIVIIGLACLLGVLYLMLAGAASRLNGVSRIPMWVLALCASAVAAAYCMLMVSHDLFVIDIYSAMGEAPHVLPTALALLLFVGGWTARTPRWRVSLMVMALVATYLSIMVKPHTLVVLALCAASLLIVGLRDVRAFRSPLVLVLCAAAAGLIVEVHRLDAWVSPAHGDFGPKTLFCNHLDVVEPVFDTSTPERARIMQLLRAVRRKPDGWVLMGYNGDRCVYSKDFTDAINAAARAEGLQPASWDQREFLHAVLKNPVAYGRDVLKQLVYFMIHPIDDVDITTQNDIAGDIWDRFAPFENLIHMSRAQFRVDVSNWVPAAYPASASIAKDLLRSVSASFAGVTLGSTLLALTAMVFLRGKVDLRPEITMVATAAFTAAFVMTTALAHTFDVGRYLTDILPVSLLWWVMGVAYLAHGLILVSVLTVRQDHRAPAGGNARLSTAVTRERAGGAVRPGGTLDRAAQGPGRSAG